MTTNAHGRRLPTLPALDGIRAIAVVVVLLYHAELAWMPGGFLGVEVFFVLSGYLITSLLFLEVLGGGISLRAFWLRRARRLLPAVFTLLAVVTAALVIGWPDEVARVRGDLAAAMGYVSNWYLIAGDHSYFTVFERPSAFRHLWSLAIEEQFYVLWPVVLGGLAMWLRRRRYIAGALLAGAFLSAMTMWLLYDAADPSRAYYGTDSRVAGLLLGAAAAILWRPWARDVRLVSAVPAWALDAGTAGSLAFLGWAFWRFDEFSAGTYRPGIQLVALATVVLIAAAVHPSSRLSRFLGWGPLRALGHRSYSIYLWHWPVFVVTRPGVDLQMGTGAALTLRIAITLVLAELSYRYVEQPFRQGTVGRTVRQVLARIHRSPVIARRAATGWTLIGALLFVSIGSLAGAVVKAAPPDRLVAEPPVESPSTSAEPSPSPGGGASAPSPTPSPAPRGRSTAVGDSVMLSARTALRDRLRPVLVDAGVARSVNDGLDALRRLRRQRKLGDAVVIHLGNNGPFRDWQFDRMMHTLRGVDRVIVVTVRVPKRWESIVNATIREGARRHPEVVIFNWHREWRSCPGRVFARDGVHLTSKGARCYANRIAARL